MKTHFALIVEDDPDAAMIFEKALQTIHVETCIASNGSLALSMLEHIIPDLIILDLHLPFVDGPTILHTIRSIQELEHIPVMIVSADPRMADMIRTEADLVLIKPASFMQVRDFAARLLRRAASAETTK